MSVHEAVAPMAVSYTEIDGIPTFYTDEPGPVFAGLMFRSGHVDETLMTKGVGHLAEHLILHGKHQLSSNCNGSVGATLTRFVVTGDSSQVTDFLNTTSRSVENIALERMAQELEVLKIESEQVSRWDDINRVRYGAGTYGLSAFTQLGHLALRPQDVHEFAIKHFTRGNAALFFSAPPPAGLEIRLPEGEYTPAPDPRDQLVPHHPGYISGPADALVLHSAVERDIAASAAAFILDSRIRHSIRFDRGIAYSPFISYTPMTEASAVVAGLIDSNPDSAPEASWMALAIIRELSAGVHPATDQEIAEYRKALAISRESLERSPRRAAALADMAVSGLDFHFDSSEADALSPAQIQQGATKILNSLILSAPGDFAPGPDFTYLESGKGWIVGGTRYRAKTVDETFGVVGSQGVSVYTPSRDQRNSAVDVQAVLASNDNYRVLVGRDGASVCVAQDDWIQGPRLIETIDHLYNDRLVRVDDDFEEPIQRSPKEQLKRMGLRFFVWIGAPLLAIVCALLTPLYSRLILIPVAVVAGYLVIFSRWRQRRKHAGIEVAEERAVAAQDPVEASLLFGRPPPWVTLQDSVPLQRRVSSPVDR